MPGTIPISLVDYLRTQYRPDCDFLEGELRERHLGERPHALLHSYFVTRLSMFEGAAGVHVLASPRLHVRRHRVRVPDVCVTWRTGHRRRVLGTPPLLCVEVLSSNETLAHMAERAIDYVRMGVRNIWIADPWTQTAFVFEGDEFKQAERALRVPDTPIKVGLENLFARLKN